MKDVLAVRDTYRLMIVLGKARTALPRTVDADAAATILKIWQAVKYA